MEIEWGKGETFTLYISSFSLYFLPLYQFHISKNVSFCCKMLNTALLLRMSQKNLTYALWENNSLSISLWESSASCEGLVVTVVIVVIVVVMVIVIIVVIVVSVVIEWVTRSPIKKGTGGLNLSNISQQKWGEIWLLQKINTFDHAADIYYRNRYEQC